MRQTLRLSCLLIFLFGLITLSSKSQISYLEKTYHFQDGLYGLVGPRGICFSPDMKNIYVCTQYTLAVFSYDTSSGETVFLKAYKDYTDGITGINGGNEVEVSPDGKFIYITSSHNCVSLFRRLEDTGLLIFETVFYDDENGNDGLRGVSGMEISESGKYMYFASHNDKKISTYQRDTVTGYITHLQSIGRYDPGGMVWPEPVKLSRDNRFVYVSSNMEDAISIFKINQSTGLLEFIQKVDSISGMWRPKALEISYDDAFLYLACYDALIIFERDIQSGTLNLIKIFDADDINVSGLHGLYSLSVSPDDKNIYTIAWEDTSFVAFSRDVNMNVFQFMQALPFEKPPMIIPHGHTNMVQDNEHVFGNAYWAMGTHKLTRSPSTGILDYDTFIHEGRDAIIDGLYNAEYSCSDYGNKNIFVTTPYNGISIFSRNDTNGILTYENVINRDSMGNYSLRYSKKSIVSLDDKYLYTLAGFDIQASILIFEIDHENHNLISIDSVTIIENGVTELQGAQDLVMSPDMKHIYVISYYHDRVLQFDYNPQNGALDYTNYYEFEDFGYTFNQIVISENGKYVFIASELNNTFLMLGRQEQSGELDYLAKCTQTLPGGMNARGLKALDISKDNKNLYAVYEHTNTLACFRIDAENDTLHLIQIIDDDTHSIDGLKEIDNIKVRHDGTFVFTSSRANHSLGMFYRKQSDGKLTFIHDFTEPEWEFDGLDGITSIEITPDDRNLYLSSEFEDGIASYKIDLYLGPDLSICDGDTALLDAGQGYKSYIWSTSDTTRQINIWEEGWYSLKTIDFFGFSDTDSMYLTVNPSPEINLGPDINTCVGDTITLYAGSHHKVLWNTGSTEDSIFVSSNGYYSVIVTNINDCSASDTITVNFHSIPEAGLGADKLISQYQTISLSVPYILGNNYLWHDGSMDTLIVIEGSSINQNLQVWVEVTSSIGCKNSDSIMIFIDKDLSPPDPEITISPVPTSENIWVKSNYTITEIKCYDMNGRHIFTRSPSSNDCKINLYDLRRGIYFIKVFLDNGFIDTRKVMRL